MLHPWTRLAWIGDEIGYGVVATRRIPRGTILWALDSLDRVFDPKQVRALGESFWPILQTYSYVNGSGKRVLCWDHGRFMNHSCDPVSLSPGVDFELAVRDVEEGEEITCDYSSLNLEQDLACLCGSSRCRGTIRAKDFATLSVEWDARLRQAVAEAGRVEQPLLGLVKEREELERWIGQPEELPSSIRHRYPFRDAVGRRARAGAR